MAPGLRIRVAAAEDAAEAGVQFLGVKGFDKVVIGAGGKHLHFVPGLPLGGEKKKRHIVAFGAQPALKVCPDGSMRAGATCVTTAEAESRIDLIVNARMSVPSILTMPATGS